MKTKANPKAAKPSASSKPNGSKFTTKAVFYTATLIAAALAILVISSFILPRLQMVEDLREGIFSPFASPQAMAEIQAELGSFFFLRLLLSAANIALLVYLLYIYVKDWLQLRTSFALGLVAFLFSFLLYALATFPPLRLLQLFRGPDIFSFVPLLFSAVGLLIFVKLSNE
ncbi:MAG: hypothetical protein KGH63_03300 [Candidatus Micrarchaeota archaeon]|nr:hypothetical protein [Candidatus Micrarchaeota archaeon]